MPLKSDVFPAPFGPMMERISPRWTTKLTSSSTRTSPKRTESAATSRSACLSTDQPASVWARGSMSQEPGRLCMGFLRAGNRFPSAGAVAQRPVDRFVEADDILLELAERKRFAGGGGKAELDLLADEQVLVV